MRYYFIFPLIFIVFGCKDSGSNINSSIPADPFKSDKFEVLVKDYIKTADTRYNDKNKVIGIIFNTTDNSHSLKLGCSQFVIDHPDVIGHIEQEGDLLIFLSDSSSLEIVKQFVDFSSLETGKIDHFPYYDSLNLPGPFDPFIRIYSINEHLSLSLVNEEN